MFKALMPKPTPSTICKSRKYTNFASKKWKFLTRNKLVFFYLSQEIKCFCGMDLGLQTMQESYRKDLKQPLYRRLLQVICLVKEFILLTWYQKVLTIVLPLKLTILDWFCYVKQHQGTLIKSTRQITMLLIFLTISIQRKVWVKLNRWVESTWMEFGFLIKRLNLAGWWM